MFVLHVHIAQMGREPDGDGGSRQTATGRLLSAFHLDASEAERLNDLLDERLVDDESATIDCAVCETAVPQRWIVGHLIRQHALPQVHQPAAGTRA